LLSRKEELYEVENNYQENHNVTKGNLFRKKNHREGRKKVANAVRWFPVFGRGSPRGDTGIKKGGGAYQRKKEK